MKSFFSKYAVKKMSNKKYCPDCGKLQKEEDVFCMDCGTKIDSSNNEALDSQQSDDTIEYGKTTQTQTTYIEQSVSTGDTKNNYVGIASFFISVLGIGFIILNNTILEWIALGLGIIGVIVGIIGLFQPHKKPIAFVGILLGLVTVAVWMTFNFG